MKVLDFGLAAVTQPSAAGSITHILADVLRAHRLRQTARGNSVRDSRVSEALPGQQRENSRDIGEVRVAIENLGKYDEIVRTAPSPLRLGTLPRTAAGKSRVRTETRLRNTGIFANYDLAPGGKRLAAFFADNATDEKPPTHLTFLLNFSGELRRDVPMGK